jgi:hypothetical protein
MSKKVMGHTDAGGEYLAKTALSPNVHHSSTQAGADPHAGWNRNPTLSSVERLLGFFIPNDGPTRHFFPPNAFASQ